MKLLIGYDLMFCDILEIHLLKIHH